MKLTITDPKTGGDLLLFNQEKNFDRLYTRDHDKKYFTIAWNRGEKQTITIDGVAHDFLPDIILPLMFDQSFYFERPADIVAWQFNREFYCIVDHDSEVSCVGFLFGSTDHLFILLDKQAQYKLKLLLDVFIEGNNELKVPSSFISSFIIDEEAPSFTWYNLFCCLFPFCTLY